jgi:very-short-patch-repair endonuclease
MGAVVPQQSKCRLQPTLVVQWGFLTLESQMRQSNLETSGARELRNSPTEAERALWSQLRYRQLGGHRFRRQRPIGNYIVDFVCLESRLVIALDGGQHVESNAYDATRTADLNKLGYLVIRFWNNQVFTEIDGVAEVIHRGLS